MITKRASKERGYAKHDWLESYHSFSFASYVDHEHVNFGPLRVINEDFIDADMGFGTHGHENMEIITYVLEGEIAHKDSMGNGSTISPGDVQRMTAGTGVRHSEFNPSKTNKTHLLQIWIHPNELNIAPGYEEKHFSREEKLGKLKIVASQNAQDGAVKIHQDASLAVGLFDGDQQHQMSLNKNRLTYVHVARGCVQVNGFVLEAGDALLMREEEQLHISQGMQAEVLVFDLPPK
jgi:redox-sensitive bicupin YhaK (pirin superfamily)